MRKIYSAMLRGCVLLPLIITSSAYAEDQNRESAAARDNQLSFVTQNRDSMIESIVATWSGVIEQNGGSPSQLQSTLEHTNDETLLSASEADSVAELNALLK